MARTRKASSTKETRSRKRPTTDDIVYLDPKTRVIPGFSHKDSLRRCKETFKKRKDLAFKRADCVAEDTAAQVLCLIYQPEREQWHFYTDPDHRGEDAKWPFDIGEFKRNFKVIESRVDRASAKKAESRVVTELDKNGLTTQPVAMFASSPTELRWPASPLRTPPRIRAPFTDLRSEFSPIHSPDFSSPLRWRPASTEPE
ncbi:hypothetical protein LTR70_004873 [Exophiala xenobiotica]|uniref:Uncharacterized protein n=1 Tax=Lithohypha guttulata TaxID=1690604 RepID=A0ABR0KC82_9EURO|nr:hypothetical protein LTR24_004491 [Lithohypha guttulata]KAK5319828.1 hypothetical protein LTR70_004873 [Exophiala xenobiotica]